MSIRRFGLFALFPFAFVAYACSDDPDPAGPDAGVDAGNGQDSGPSPLDDGGGASDGGPDGTGPGPGCTGNPLAEGDAGVVLDPSTALVAIATGRFLDGPQWIDDGANSGVIVYSEVDTQTVVRNAPDGGSRAPLRATGLENLPIGNGRTGNFIYTALSRTTAGGGGGSILRMLLDGGEPTQFPSGEGNSPNDLVASSKGFVYFTDPGYQTDGISTGVFRMAPDGAITTVSKVDGGTGARADGIALSSDETTLFVAFNDERRIAKYTIDADGVATNPQNVPLTLTDNPTGLAVDNAGNLWVAESSSTNLTAPGRVEVFAADGTKWGEVPFTDSRPTGVTFGGADGKTVYITTERGNVENGTLFTMTSRCGGPR
jgi:gluconolactonase